MLLKDIAVVIGMPRAGTTWLYENLKNHPDICVSAHKEINRYLLGMNDKQYLDYFMDCSKKMRIDISPLYFFDKKALAEIGRKHDKIILLVREPTAWIESLNSQISKYSGNIAEMIDSKKYVFSIEGKRIVNFDYGAYQHDLYIDDIKNLFGDKLLMLDFSLLQSDPVGLLNAIESYLGISNYFTAEKCFLKKINSSDQSISKMYSLLLRLNILHRLIPIALKLLTKGMVHWLRKYFVYGR